MRLNPFEGEIWKHYKGDWYRIIGIAEQESDGVHVVVYRSLRTSKTFTRPLFEFMEILEGDVKRFEKIGDPPPTDLDNFVDLYARFGIHCDVQIDTDTKDRVIVLGDNSKASNAKQFGSTKTNRISGYRGLFCEVRFNEKGRFINQMFLEQEC